MMQLTFEILVSQQSICKVNLKPHGFDGFLSRNSLAIGKVRVRLNVRSHDFWALERPKPSGRFVVDMSFNFVSISHSHRVWVFMLILHIAVAKYVSKNILISGKVLKLKPSI